MTVQQYMGDRIENAGKLLAHFVATTAPERRDWVPPVEGAVGLRSVLAQAGECILVNRMIDTLLRGETPPPFSPIDAPRPFENPDDAVPMLVESAAALADTVRGLSDEALARTYHTRRGAMAGANLIEMPYRNMTYHGGQVNLIQLLYGDGEFHIPAPPAPEKQP